MALLDFSSLATPLTGPPSEPEALDFSGEAEPLPDFSAEAQPLEQPGIGDYVGEAAKGLPRGAIGIVGTALKGTGAVGLTDPAAIDDILVRMDDAPKMTDAEFDEFRRQIVGAIPTTGPGNQQASMQLQAMAWARRQGRDYPLSAEKIRGMLDERHPEETGFYQAGQAVQDFSQEALPVTPGFEDSWTRKLTEGLGSTVPFLAAGFTGPAGVPLAMTLGSWTSTGEAVDRAIAEGASHSDIIRASRLGQIPGVTEVLPIELVFERVPLPYVGRVTSALGKILTIAAAEGGQEAVQETAQNFIAKYVYKPDQDLLEGVAEAAIIGTAVGAKIGTAKAVIDRVRGIEQEPTRARKADQEAVPPEAAPVPEGAVAAETLYPAPAEAAPAEPAPQAPAPLADDIAVLLEAGLTEQQILDMNAAELAQAAQEARDAGLAPPAVQAPAEPEPAPAAPAVAPEAMPVAAEPPAPGTAPMVPRERPAEAVGIPEEIPDAEAVRVDQGQPAPEGQVGERGQAVSRPDIQRIEEAGREASDRPAQAEAGQVEADAITPETTAQDQESARRASARAEAAPDPVKIDPDQRRVLERDIAAIIRRQVGKRPRILFADSIPLADVLDPAEVENLRRAAQAGGTRLRETAGGFWRRDHGSAESFIAVAMADPGFAPRNTAYHESFHHIMEVMATDAEHAVLTSEGEQAKMRRLIEPEYGPEFVAGLPDYEVAPMAYARFAETGDAKGLSGAVIRLFRRLRLILADIKRALARRGYNSMEEIFDAAYAGRFAERGDVAEGGEGRAATGVDREQRLTNLANAISGRMDPDPDTDMAGALVEASPRVESAPKRLAKGLGFFESVTDTLRRADHPRLTDLAQRIELYYDKWDARAGYVNGRIRPILKTLGIGPVTSQKRIQEITKPFEDYWRHHDNGREAEAQKVIKDNQAIADLVEAVKASYEYAGNENQRHGVQVYDATLNDGKGGWRPIGKVKRGEFWPRSIRPEVQQVLRNPTHDPDLWHEMVDALINEGHIDHPSEALAYLNRYFTDEIRVDYFAGIEKARLAKLPEIFYDYSFDAFRRYVRRWSRRVSQIEAFGQETGPGTKDAFAEVSDATFDEYTRRYLNRVADVIYETRDLSGWETGLGLLNLVATGSQLGNPATATLNLIGGSTLNVQKFGARRTAQAMAKLVLQWNKMQQDGARLGILGKDVLNLLRDSEREAVKYFEPEGKARNALARFADFTMTWGGYKPTENIIRATAMIAAKMQLNEALRAWNSNPSSLASREYRAAMEALHIDPQKLLAENGSGPETATYLRRSVNVPQGSYRIDMVPLHVDTPAGRFVWKYQKFTTQVSRMFWQHNLRPFIKAVEAGDTALATKHFVRMLAYFTAAGVGGSLILAARAGIFNYTDPGDDWDDIKNALADKDTGRSWGMIMSRAWHSMMAASMLGFFGNYIQFVWDIADRQRVKNPLEPPGLASLDAIKELVLRGYEQGTLSARDFEDIARRTIAFYRAYKGAALTGAELAGNEWKETRLHSVRRDLNYVSKMLRRYADQADITQKTTAYGRFAKTPMSPINQSLYEALILGDGASARAIVRETLFGMPPEERKRALLSMKSSARSRMPIKVGGSTSAAQRAAFMRWAKETMSPANYARTLELDLSYRRAAAQAGLLGN